MVVAGDVLFSAIYDILAAYPRLCAAADTHSYSHIDIVPIHSAQLNLTTRLCSIERRLVLAPDPELLTHQHRPPHRIASNETMNATLHTAWPSCTTTRSVDLAVDIYCEDSE
ncbi:hypothetical protein GSI_05349 [Ganoderma sinense ZZ0214-1]|uniref:Uncharacterized protein n=1 Tax=Ganoderma sinense ZZ0214-1 TaxID=1077348 RepID=A0A2G8SFU3_9APHY|nr:hypothetical protein GSI_05349 [Ganoderma sinense ZZ0214-1]